MTGKATRVDEIVSVALTCKYMGWDYNTYMNQPEVFIEVINTLRREEIIESERQKKNNG